MAWISSYEWICFLDAFPQMIWIWGGVLDLLSFNYGQNTHFAFPRMIWIWVGARFG